LKEKFMIKKTANFLGIRGKSTGCYCKKRALIDLKHGALGLCRKKKGKGRKKPGPYPVNQRKGRPTEKDSPYDSKNKKKM